MYRPGRIAPTGKVEAMDDLVERNVLSLLKATGPNLAAQAAPQNADLVSGLVSKVVALESQNATLREQLQSLQQQRQQHSSKPQQLLQDQQPGRCACEQHVPQVQHLQLELQRLRQQCKAAWQQVAEMKGFLNDYGLVWVGQPMQLEVRQECCSTACEADACAASHMDSPISPPAKGSLPSAAAAVAGGCAAAAQLPFDMSELQECLDKLNQLAGDGIAQLKQLGGTPAQPTASPHSSSSSRGKALHLVIPDPVKLAIYKDGLVLHHCPPLPYRNEAADGILTDIFDGYFPSALKGDFPDGIPIQLVDRSGQTLAGATAAAAAQKGSNIIGWQDLEQQQLQGLSGLAAVSGQAFLDRLPKTVIRNQQVVSVRPVVEQYINGSSSSSSGAVGKIYIRPSSCSGGLARWAPQGAAAAVAAAVAAAAAAGQHSSSTGVSAAPQQQQQQQATIQVKSEDGKQTYVLMLPYTATIAALRSSIDKHRSRTGITCRICQQQQQTPTKAPALVDCSSTDGDPHGGAAEGGPADSRCGVCCGYELRSAFPAQLYADGSLSLEQAGLVPSATLFMRHTAV